jgi:hypothetical protein
VYRIKGMSEKVLVVIPIQLLPDPNLKWKFIDEHKKLLTYLLHGAESFLRS